MRLQQEGGISEPHKGREQEYDQPARTFCGVRVSSQHCLGRRDSLTHLITIRWPREGTALRECGTQMPQPCLSRCSLKWIRCFVPDVRSKEKKGVGRAGSCRPMSAGLALGYISVFWRCKNPVKRTTYFVLSRHAWNACWANKGMQNTLEDLLFCYEQRNSAEPLLKNLCD